MYGCENRHDPALFLKERVLIYMLSQTSPDKIHYPSCKFKVQRYKEGTGRIVMWAQGLVNSFTLEASLCGTTMVNPPKHFSTRDLKDISHQFCDALLDYCDPDPTKYITACNDVENHMRQKLMAALGRTDMASRSGEESRVFTGNEELTDLLAESLLVGEGDDSSR